MKLSIFQKNIIEHTLTSTSNLAVNAVAGSGKTTTMRLVAEAIIEKAPRASIAAVAFNKSIATALAGKMPEGVTCSTIHSLGLKAIAKMLKRRPKVESRKASRKATKMLQDLGFDPWDKGDDRDVLNGRREFSRRALDLASKARQRLCKSAACIEATAEHHDIDLGVPEEMAERVNTARFVLDLIEACREDTSQIDFDDMIELPLSAPASIPKFKFVLVDEAQDLSPLRLAFTKAMRSPRGGKLVYVGDRRQAIYGFAGSSSNAFDEIITATDADELPLSVCYRCPSSHLDMAREIVPEIEARDDAPEGFVDTWEAGEVETRAAVGDLIICRRNAPLVGLTFRLLAAGQSASMAGRELGQGLIAVAKKHGIDAEGRAAFMAAEERKARAAVGNDDARIEARLATARDKISCIDAVVESIDGSTDIKAFEAAVKRLFDKDATITLSSVHRAKGLEADRVVLVEPHLLGSSKYATQEWQKTQEVNLRYVALTRAKTTLVFVEG
jgi:superfamily I DNA/RNA helicase